MIRAVLYPLAGDTSRAVAIVSLDGGMPAVDCADPDLQLRLRTALELPIRVASTTEEIGEELEPGTEAHFRAVLSREVHLGLHAVFEASSSSEATGSARRR